MIASLHNLLVSIFIFIPFFIPTHCVFFFHIHAAANNKIGLKNLAQFEFGGELLIISYDQLKIFGDRLGKVKGIGLVICDEGHRLKNSTIQTSIAVEKLKTLRRIVVTGTPVYVMYYCLIFSSFHCFFFFSQNNLEEFRAMVNYVNPGILGAPEQFKALFETPIYRGRDKHVSFVLFCSCVEEGFFF